MASMQSPGGGNTSDDLDDLSTPFNRGLNFVPTVDCKFIVGPKSEILMGNRMIFALESPEFERMLCDKSTEIRLINEDPSVFRNLRYIMYNKTSSTLEQYSIGEILQIYKICKEYKVPFVEKLCRDHVMNLAKSNSSITSAIEGYFFGLEFKDDDVIKSADDYFKSQAETDQLNLFNIIESFFGVEANVLPLNQEMRHMILQRCLSHVDFRKMTKQQFLDGPGNSNILNSEQKYFILKQKCFEAQCKYCAQSSKLPINIMF